MSPVAVGESLAERMERYHEQIVLTDRPARPSPPSSVVGYVDATGKVPEARCPVTSELQPLPNRTARASHAVDLPGSRTAGDVE